MPSKNTVKQYGADVFYHAYNRGNNRQLIFQEPADYAVFMNLLKRYLAGGTETDKYGRFYPDLSQKVELLAFCLMPNHYHLLLYQYEPDGMRQLLQRVATSYSGYFNQRYKRVGKLFQGVYKASVIDNEAYLWHISRYIHLNPKDWSNYSYSSYPYFAHARQASWLKPDRILAMHEESGSDYTTFLQDGEGYKQTLEAIKKHLASY
jgi:putative transposase